MSLASTQADIDAAVASLLSSIDSYQAAYYSTYGTYWQGLVSHTIVPANGTSVAASNLSATPTDQTVTWATFGVTPGTIPAAVQVDVYKKPTGAQGYTKKVLFIYSAGFYSTSTDSGNNPSGNVSWGSTPDATAPANLAAPTYTSISPSSGSTSGGTSITLTVTGAQSGVAVTVGGASCTSVTPSSDGTSITGTTPSGSAGAKDVVITNIDNQSVTAAGAYTYTASTPSFVKYGTGSASSTNDLSLSWTSGSATAGNCLLAIVETNSGVAPTSSSGWTQLQTGLSSTTCWYKIAAGGDSAVWAWGGAAKADKAQGLMIEISGSNASSPIDVSAASTSTYVSPSVTTSTGTLVVSLGGGSSNTAFSTQPSGWTLAVHGSTNNGTGIAYKTFASSGATGTASWNNDGTEIKVFTVAVKP